MRSKAGAWGRAFRWWSMKRIVVFFKIIAILGCFIGFGTIRVVWAQDGSAASTGTVLRSDLKPTRFWISASPSTSGNTWDAPSPEVISAVILDINELEIIYASEKDTTATRLSSLRLQAIEVIWASDSGRNAHAAFIRNDFKAALDLLKTAIANGELPRWQQRFLAAELTECLTNLEKTSIACSVFISLCKVSAAPMLYASAPLNWTSQRADTGLIQQAKEWLGPDKQPVSQLLAASWLLIGSDESRSAQSTLEKLSRSKSTAISLLATAQLWRVAPPNQVIEQYPTWTILRDRMPLPLQVGPTTALAHKLEKAGQSEAALQEWLRVIAICPTQHKAFKDARFAAIELLKGLGRDEEARRLEGDR